ncbi:T9SS type A sorting domain-containing protein [Fulvivirga sp. M361]|uniref:T9SS type A sorting domain-containing protein n=1 Tax=Fulvivirga sp. M361 TaxID=2594266 RepID=UPI00117B90DA|nr:T9SS type A sorting domain-containing protein [Fulvivirga sp. M361]TRX58205.1 T9SS type A sorting domain-containing protein [Fulvivirga sp. M361]
MKDFFNNYRKKLQNVLAIIVLTCCALNVKAQVDIFGSDTVLINATNVEYILDIGPRNPADFSDISWGARGDLQLESVSVDGFRAFYSSVKRNTAGQILEGYGLGQVVVSYTDSLRPSVCGRPNLGKRIFKKFGKATEIDNIIGPSCIKPGDTVTYSILPIVSVNINDRIGIDKYKWTLPPGWESGIQFYSGDSSSITFIVGALSGNDMLKVDIGQANFNDTFEYELNLALGVDDPIFDIAPPICLSLDSTKFTVDVAAIAGLEYTWGFGPGTSWGFGEGTGAKDERIVVNVDDRVGILTLQIKGACDQPLDTTFIINRQFGTSNELISVNGTCLNGGAEAVFSITNSDADVQWLLPGGWNFANANVNLSTVTLIAGLQSDTLRAVSASCPGDTLALAVDIIPLTPENLQGDDCIPNGLIGDVSYMVTPVDNAVSYTWTFPASFSPNTLTTTIPSATVTANPFEGIGNVTVRANGCQNSAVSTLPVAYGPNVPTNLDGPTCIGLDSLSNYFTYSVDNQVGVAFKWKLPVGWGFEPGTSETGNTVSVTPNGNVGDNSFIEVSAIGCDTTAISSLEVVIEGDGGFNFSVVQFPGTTFYQIIEPSYNFSSADQIVWTFSNESGTVMDSVVLPNGIVYGQIQCEKGTLTARVIDRDACINATALFTIDTCLNALNASAARTMQSSSIVSADFKVMPNPITDKINLTLPPTETTFTIVLLNAEGRQLIIKESDARMEVINMWDRKPGVYFLLVNDGTNKFSTRLIKE